MKFARLFIIVVLLILNFACLPNSCSKITFKKNNAILLLGTSPDYPPYESIDENGDVIGFDIDVALAIAQELGKKIVIIQMSFDSLILALDHGKIDLIISGVSSTPSRREKIALIPYQGKATKEYTLLFWEKLPLNIKSYEDLKYIKKPIFCVQSGTSMAEFLYQIPEITVKTLESTPDLLLDVVFKKSSAALVETNAALTLKKQNPKLQLLTLPLPQKNWVIGYGIGVKKNNKQLRKKIEETVLKLKSQGLLKKIEEKWL